VRTDIAASVTQLEHALDAAAAAQGHGVAASLTVQESAV